MDESTDTVLPCKRERVLSRLPHPSMTKAASPRDSRASFPALFLASPGTLPSSTWTVGKRHHPSPAEFADRMIAVSAASRCGSMPGLEPNITSAPVVACMWLLAPRAAGVAGWPVRSTPAERMGRPPAGVTGDGYTRRQRRAE